MKSTITLLLVVASIAIMAQDKIIKKSGSIIECSVSEVGSDEIKYFYQDNPKIVFGIDKALIERIEFATGEIMKIESNTFNNPEYYANQGTHAVKISFLSQLNSSTEFTYEQSLKPGKSWEASLGIIGLGFDLQDKKPEGAYGKFAFKFIKSPDFYTHQMHYSHILKGAYFAPEIAFRYVHYEDYDYWWYSNTDSKKTKEDYAFALTLKFGKQWVFDDSFLVDLYFGIGYGAGGNGDGLSYGFVAGNEDLPIALTSGLRLGWVF